MSAFANTEKKSQSPIQQRADLGPQATSRSDVRDQLRGMSYAEGAAALSPSNPNNLLQCKGGAGAGAGVHQAAAEGVKGGGGTLPYLNPIQNSFGRHDVSGIDAYVGGNAKGACESMGAEAYASGNSVAFKGSPTLHTAAHEAAHIVQQRAGVSLKGGVGAVGDQYETHADAVADLVVQGKSAEGLLDTMAGSGGSAAGPVQMRRNRTRGGAGQMPDRFQGMVAERVALTGISIDAGRSVDWISKEMPAAHDQWPQLARHYNEAMNVYEGDANEGTGVRGSNEKTRETYADETGVDERGEPLQLTKLLKNSEVTDRLIQIQNCRGEMEAMALERSGCLHNVQAQMHIIKSAMAEESMELKREEKEVKREELASVRSDYKAAKDAADDVSDLIGEAAGDALGLLVNPAKKLETLSKWLGKGLGACFGFALNSTNHEKYKKQIASLSADVATIRRKISSQVQIRAQEKIRAAQEKIRGFADEAKALEYIRV